MQHALVGQALPPANRAKRGTFAILCALILPLSATDLPRFRWENFTTAQGLPDNRVYSVCVDGDRVWAGTDNGLALYEHDKWRVFTPQDGLAHRAVLYVTLDKRTHDVWAATMGGLTRYSAGRFDTFTQLSSGLANDVVYSVSEQGDFVWVATAAGGSRLNTRTGEWSLSTSATRQCTRSGLTP
jgi:ligand-binding sensor domain-containing protein